MIIKLTPSLISFKLEYLILFFLKAERISSNKNSPFSFLIVSVSTSNKRYDPPLKSNPRLSVFLGNRGTSLSNSTKFGRANKAKKEQKTVIIIFFVREK